jgi:hypothetical protein
MYFPATLFLVQKDTMKYISDGVLQKAYNIQMLYELEKQEEPVGYTVEAPLWLLGEIEKLH